MSEEYPVTYLGRNNPQNKWGIDCFITIHCSACDCTKSAIGAKFVQGEQFGRMLCAECAKEKV